MTASLQALRGCGPLQPRQDCPAAARIIKEMYLHWLPLVPQLEPRSYVAVSTVVSCVLTL